MAAELGLPTSPDTILRRVTAAAGEPALPPRYVGLDDWAIRKGHTYGTILIDLERGTVIDLLPGRDGESLKAWLASANSALLKRTADWRTAVRVGFGTADFRCPFRLEFSGCASASALAVGIDADFVRAVVEMRPCYPNGRWAARRRLIATKRSCRTQGVRGGFRRGLITGRGGSSFSGQ